ncbi:MAG: alpha/beta fold hydrolase [Nocardioidaceae bacterium]
MTTVVLVHGLFGAFGDERTWSRLAAHRVVVPDLLGYGENAATSTPVALEAQVKHLRELVGDEPVHVVGHSVGAVISTLYAHRYPGDVLELVNVEGNFTLADAFWSAELARKPAAEAEALLESYRADPGGWFGGTTDPYQLASTPGPCWRFEPASTLQATPWPQLEAPTQLDRASTARVPDVEEDERGRRPVERGEGGRPRLLVDIHERLLRDGSVGWDAPSRVRWTGSESRNAAGSNAAPAASTPDGSPARSRTVASTTIGAVTP